MVAAGDLGPKLEYLAEHDFDETTINDYTQVTHTGAAIWCIVRSCYERNLNAKSAVPSSGSTLSTLPDALICAAPHRRLLADGKRSSFWLPSDDVGADHIQSLLVSSSLRDSKPTLRTGKPQA